MLNCESDLKKKIGELEAQVAALEAQIIYAIGWRVSHPNYVPVQQKNALQ